MERTKGRLVWALTVLVFFFIMAAARMAYIQVIQGDHYSRIALAAETTEISLEDHKRGQILDRNLKPLTGSFSANRIVVFPRFLENAGEAVAMLSGVTGVEESTILDLISSKNPVVLPFSVTSVQTDKIEKAGLKGVIVAPYSYRYGPGALAAHVVGSLGRVKDLEEMNNLTRSGDKKYRLSDWTGRLGLEYFYEQELKGAYPSRLAGICVDARGNLLPGLPALVNTRMGDFTRSDVVTTIDAGIQEAVEGLMDRHIKKGAVVVMDVSSGDILAIASRPAFSPYSPAEGHSGEEEEERYINQAISCFQPGSVFKVVLAVAAITEGIVKPDTKFYCAGSSASPVRCWKHEGHGTITFSEAFAHSCNPAFVKIGRDLGANKIIEYAKKLGLDNQLILGYPSAPDRRQNLDLIAGEYNLANSSIGQGPVLTTPLQITAMTNVIASGGFYVQPRLVNEVRPSRGPVVEISPAARVKVMTPEIADQAWLLMEAVTKNGVGQRAWVPEAGSAGKTGSAEVGEEGAPVNAWFSGYAPLNNPRYTITVLAREGTSGAETAAPLFREIAEKILK
ncbi:MAG: peptidoglycan D,D-transpeptidase FtsI family protein [Bacillota bacterium]